MLVQKGLSGQNFAAFEFFSETTRSNKSQPRSTQDEKLHVQFIMFRRARRRLSSYIESDWREVCGRKRIEEMIGKRVYIIQAEVERNSYMVHGAFYMADLHGF